MFALMGKLARSPLEMSGIRTALSRALRGISDNCSFRFRTFLLHTAIFALLTIFFLGACGGDRTESAVGVAPEVCTAVGGDPWILQGTPCAAAGAALLELAFSGRLDNDAEAVLVVDGNGRVLRRREGFQTPAEMLAFLVDR